MTFVNTDCYRPFHAQEAMRAIGNMNVAAISGGRCIPDFGDGSEYGEGFVMSLAFPVTSVWSVVVMLHDSDEYEVFRMKNGKVEGSQRCYFDIVGEIAYRASCYMNVEFGT